MMVCGNTNGFPKIHCVLPLDYHLIRASMVVMFLFFGYQKWFDYEALALIPYINHALSFSGCTPYSASKAPLTSSELRSGCFGALSVRLDPGVAQMDAVLLGQLLVEVSHVQIEYRSR